MGGLYAIPGHNSKRKTAIGIQFPKSRADRPNDKNFLIVNLKK